MPLDPRSPAYQSALESFAAEVEKTMKEKLSGIGDYRNLAELEGEIDRLQLRMELLAADPEFAEVAKRVEARRLDLTRKRDQIKPFLVKLERELLVYKSALQAGSLGIPLTASPAPGQAPAPVARAAPPRVAPAMPPDLPLSLEEDADRPVLASPHEFLESPDPAQESFSVAELVLDTNPGVPAPEPAAPPAPPSPPPQWPPAGVQLPDPFANFQPAARPQAPRPAPPPQRPATPPPQPKPAAPAPAAAPVRTPSAKPPWQK